MAAGRLDLRTGFRLALLAALALRVVFGMVYWTDKPLTHDEHEYLALAASLAGGHGFTYIEPAAGTTAQFGRAPGYPAFLAMIGAGSTSAESTPTRVKLVQAVLGTATVWLIAATAGRVGPNARAARLDTGVCVVGNVVFSPRNCHDARPAECGRAS
jgi:hypothetical protein